MRTFSQSLNPDRLVKPSFSVHKNGTDQLNITSIDKVEWTTEDFDTNNNFDVATNFRHTPTVAGKYFYDVQIAWVAGTVAADTRVHLYIYKNGAAIKENNESGDPITYTTTIRISALVDMNGSTDYIEIFAQYSSNNDADIEGASDRTWFTGYKID